MTENDNNLHEDLTQQAVPEPGAAEFGGDTYTGADSENEEESALAAAQTKIAEYDDRYKRLFAEFENFRRRTAKERLEMISGANADLLLSLLPVVDDLDRAVKARETSQDLAAFGEGVALVQQKLKSILERKGLKPFESKGELFDADRHEAITQIPAPTGDLKSKVVDEVEKGYMLGEKVLRFAKVVVGV